MDVNKLRKINQLTATLKKHGIASGSEDASEMASRISGKNSDSDYNDVIAQCDDMNMHKKAVSGQKENEVQTMIEPKGMSEEQIVTILQKFADQVCGEVNSMNQRIEKQNQTINELNKKLEAASMQPQRREMHRDNDDDGAVNEIISQKEEQIERRAPEVQHAEQRQPAARGPRSGNYQSSDVSIDKFFYCGTR